MCLTKQALWSLNVPSSHYVGTYLLGRLDSHFQSMSEYSEFLFTIDYSSRLLRCDEFLGTWGGRVAEKS